MTDAITVTPDNFRRAETDLYFHNMVEEGAFGTIIHGREATPIDEQTIVRMNRDTLYSKGVFDLDAGPVTITTPDPGDRFLSLQVWDEDEYCPLVAYGAGRHTFTREDVGTRYVGIGIRILVDPTSDADIAEVHALQDAITVKQASTGAFEIPHWDKSSQDHVREALEKLGRTLPDTHRTFGVKGEVDPVRHLIGAAIGWGGSPEKDAFYVNVSPLEADGKTVYRLHVPPNVPVDGFWSISVYNDKGYFEANPQGAYTVNSVTAAKNADGSVDVQLGGERNNAANWIATPPNWTAAVRLYRPRQEILDGSWRFPQPQPVQ